MNLKDTIPLLLLLPSCAFGKQYNRKREYDIDHGIVDQMLVRDLTASLHTREQALFARGIDDEWDTAQSPRLLRRGGGWKSCTGWNMRIADETVHQACEKSVSVRGTEQCDVCTGSETQFKLWSPNMQEQKMEMAKAAQKAQVKLMQTLNAQIQTDPNAYKEEQRLAKADALHGERFRNRQQESERYLAEQAAEKAAELQRQKAVEREREAAKRDREAADSLLALSNSNGARTTSMNSNEP